jgi:hypothetical protein
VMKAAQACDPNSGTQIFQHNDQSVSYLELILNFEAVDFTELCDDFENPVLTILSGGNHEQ